MNAGDDVRDDYEPAAATHTDDLSTGADVSPQPSSNPWFLTNEPEANRDVRHITKLEDKIADLEARILELERVVTLLNDISANAKSSVVNTRASRLHRTVTTKALMKAGISEEMAAEMVRHRNDLELRKLELRDRASREGYLSSRRYMRELSALVADEMSLREELGDDTYDRYLYVNGQPNRVKVTSVMLGSAAELAGMKDGDLILTYAQHRVFEWSELKRDTSKGELGEYVNVDILRDGELMSLWVPRGPLGVRLGAARIAP